MGYIYDCLIVSVCIQRKSAVYISKSRLKLSAACVITLDQAGQRKCAILTVLLTSFFGDGADGYRATGHRLACGLVTLSEPCLCGGIVRLAVAPDASSRSCSLRGSLHAALDVPPEMVARELEPIAPCDLLAFVLPSQGRAAPGLGFCFFSSFSRMTSDVS